MIFLLSAVVPDSEITGLKFWKSKCWNGSVRDV